MRDSVSREVTLERPAANMDGGTSQVGNNLERVATNRAEETYSSNVNYEIVALSDEDDQADITAVTSLAGSGEGRLVERQIHAVGNDQVVLATGNSLPDSLPATCNSVPDLKRHSRDRHARSKHISLVQYPASLAHVPDAMLRDSDHSGSKPYLCKYCGKGFPTSTNQKRHERIHEGARSHGCALCPAAFNISDDLRKHIKSCHRQGCHACYHCSLSFETQLELEEHLPTHKRNRWSNNKVVKRLAEKGIDARVGNSTVKYICSMCNKAFSHYGNLCRHRRLRHDVQFKSQSSFGRADVVASSYVINIAENVCDNVTYFVDGTIEQIASLAKKNCGEKVAESTKPLVNAVTWSKYNFPDGFNPVERAGFDERVSLVEGVGDQNTPVSAIVAYANGDLTPELSMVQHAKHTLAGFTHKIPGIKSGLASSEIHQCQICKVLFINYPLYSQHMRSKHPKLATNDSAAQEQSRSDQEAVAPTASAHKQPRSKTPSSAAASAPCKCDEPLDLTASKPDALAATAMGPRRRTSPQVPRNSVSANFEKCRNSSMCFACMKDFKGEYTLLRKHQQNAHPIIDFGDYDLIVSTGLCRYISAVGVLSDGGGTGGGQRASEPAPRAFSCTNCERSFESLDDFHSHIVFECATDALHNLSKTRSPRGRPPKNSPWLTRLRLLGKTKRKLKFGTAAAAAAQPATIEQANGAAAASKKRNSKKLTEGPITKKRAHLTASTLSKTPAPGVDGSLIDIHKCEPCDKSFSYISYLEKHLKICPHFTREGRSVDSLQEKLEEQVKKQRTCPTCGRYFPFSATLRRHLRQGCDSVKELANRDDAAAAAEARGDSKQAAKKHIHAAPAGSDSPALAKCNERSQMRATVSDEMKVDGETAPEAAAPEERTPEPTAAVDIAEAMAALASPVMPASDNSLAARETLNEDPTSAVARVDVSAVEETDDVAGGLEEPTKECPASSEVSVSPDGRSARKRGTDAGKVVERRASLRHRAGKHETRAMQRAVDERPPQSGRTTRRSLSSAAMPAAPTKEASPAASTPKRLKLSPRKKDTAGFTPEMSQLRSLRHTRSRSLGGGSRAAAKPTVPSLTKRKGGWPKGKPRKPVVANAAVRSDTNNNSGAK
ncbi:PREDICTED: uncharacterized protein LOC106808394 [Priapulus caudatus]|uniref:Uncharacterized protein LOC106808394 n=1 Tax=Priapulus caudatus TaxID=37621 RepID=A0ABM1E316_PRICU|nr:PREDICTED: uncharacterized protein LOC106808394 [Priapulus caudatus]XP_014666588.1 PREDICTED: uncharacterized protein LOC106808394 [Priapulus caudatus]XP_014666589.1 PREDICTED: uncharacterized protein LOC106808394 [Priapulus caudatus]XP_014666590.1 PREDICTED: uncharacterized protein LOC106808394 [Priapulus caudatus]